MKSHLLAYSKIFLGLLVVMPALAQQSSDNVDKLVPIIGVTNEAINAHLANGKNKKSSLVLPLDHGPHAATTPWANQQKRLHAEQLNQKSRDAKISLEPTVPMVK